MYKELRYFKVIKNFLESTTFDEDGFKYDFGNIVEKDGAVQFDVEVTLPKQGQSWVSCKFEWDVRNILHNLQGYIGEGFSVSYKTTIDGVDIEELGYCHVSPEKQKEIIHSLNKELHVFVTSAFSTKSTMSMDFSFRKPSNKFYMLDGDYFTFDLDVNVKKISIDGKIVKPDLNKLDLIAGTIYDKLMDSDFRSEVEGEIYSVLEPEIKIHNVDDCYIQSFLNIVSIDGLPTVQKEEYYDFPREWFT